MVSNTLLTIVAIPLIFSSMLLLGKYISKSQEIFINNKAGSFMTGAIVYLFVTFVVLFPFMWTNLGITYFIIIFMIKEALLYIFLITNMEFKINWKTLRWLGTLIVTSILITVIYNLGITKYVSINTSPNQIGNFLSWDKMESIFESFFKMSSSYAKNWFMTMIVSGIAYATIVAFIKDLVNWRGFWIEFSAFIILIVVLSLFTFGISLYALLGIFIVVFMILLSIRLVDTSRRRYGVLYGLSTITLYSATPHLLIAVLFLSLATMSIYTILKKPKNSLFWVQLFAPAGIVGALSIYDYSEILAFVTFGIALFAYAFVLAAGRAKFMNKINMLFEKARFIIPIVVVLIFVFVSTAIYITTGAKFDFKTMFPSIVYSTFTNSFAENLVQEILYYSLLAIGLIYIGVIWYKREKITTVRMVMIIGLATVLFIYNPISKVIFDASSSTPSFTYMKSIIFIPLIIMIPRTFDKIYKRKHQIA